MDFDKFFVGFDRLLDVGNYPPFNLRKVEDKFLIELAVAGVGKKDLNIEVSQNKLTISGKPKQNPLDTYLHKGISNKSFTRTFALANHIKVASAELNNGLLSITLESVLPETKTQKVEIK
jgi:molecular chaperone IbpA